VGGKNVPEAVSWGEEVEIDSELAYSALLGGGFNYFFNVHPGSLGK